MVKCKFQDLNDLADAAALTSSSSSLCRHDRASASMVSSPKKRKDAEKESSETSHLQPAASTAVSLPPSAPLASSTTIRASSAPSSSSYKQPSAKESKIDTQLKRHRVDDDAQETDKPPTSRSSATMQEPRYYTRSAARRLPPPSPSQLRAGKYVVSRCDQIAQSREHVVGRRSNHERRRFVFENTFLRRTTTTIARPPVPPAPPSPSGVVPLGPPPSREPGQAVSPRIRAMQRRAAFRHPTWLQPSGRKALSPVRATDSVPGTSGSGAGGAQNPPPVAARSFELLPPPSVSYYGALEILTQFIDGLEGVTYETLEEAKDPLLKLQIDLGLPEWTGLFELFASNQGERTEQMVDVMEYLMDYFNFWFEKSADQGPSERRDSSGFQPEKDLERRRRVSSRKS